MKRKNTLLPTTLGFLAAFGPFVTDFYLPAMPTMRDFFLTTESNIQLTLTASLLGLAIGQIFIGPISDKIGRKKPLLASLIIFIASTLACLLAPNIQTFIALRFLQGFAGAGGIVLSKSISTDLFHGNALTTFMALLAAINGIAPVSAPVCGGLMLTVSNWQGIFVLLLVIGIILLVLSMALPETLTPKRRQQGSILKAFKNLFKVLSNPLYLLCLIAMATSMGVLFAYISASPFILQEQYALSPMWFAFCFAVNALSIGIGSALCSKIKNDHKSLIIGGPMLLLLAIGTALALYHKAPLALTEVFFFLLLFAFGIIQPPVTAMALDSERTNAGAASAILGASGFLLGGIVSPIVGSGNIMHTTGTVMVICAAISALFCLLLSRNNSTKNSL